MDPTPVLITMTLFLVIGGVLALWLVTKHKERTMMLEKGFKPEEIKELYHKAAHSSPNPLSSLKWGLVFTAIGIAILLGLYMDSMYDLDEGIYFGLIAFFGGVGLMLYYAFSKRAKQA